MDRRPRARGHREHTAAWVARGAVGFAEGPGIATEDTLLWGFGLEGITTRAQRAAVVKDAVTYLTRARLNPPPAPGPPPATYGTSQPGTVGGNVPATLSLTLGPAAAVRRRSPPASQKTYFASTAANVISTAGDALLSVSDPSSFGTGHLVNGTFVLPEPLQARARNAANTGTAYNNVGSASPLNLLTWSGPVSNDAVTLEFSQLVKANDPLRTGTYARR